jgi:acyl carrier protein
MNAEEEVKKALLAIAPDASLGLLDENMPFREQIKMDSLDTYNFITQLHKQTGVNIPISKLAELQNMNDLIAYMSAHVTG